MAIYLFVMGYLALFALAQIVGDENMKGLSKYFYVAICLLIFLIAGCRYGLEADYWHYNDIFNGTSEQVVEPGFLLLIGFVRLFTHNYNLFLMIVAALSFGIKAKLMDKFKYCFLLMLTYYLRYFVLFELNGIRQGLSLAIVMIAVMKFVDGDKKGFILITLLASMIHMSSATLLVALFLDKKTIKLPVLLGMCVAAVIFRLYFLDTIMSLGRIFNSSILSSGYHLIRGTQYIFNGSLVSDELWPPIIRSIIQILCFYWLRTSGILRGKYNVLFNIYLIGCLINICFVGLDTISYRLAATFCCVECLLLGYTTQNGPQFSLRHVKIKKTFAYSAIIACNLWSFINMLNTSETLVPYRTFFFQ